MKNLISCFFIFFVVSCDKMNDDQCFIIYKANPEVEIIKFYLKNADSLPIKNLDNLSKYTASKGEYLKFAMNGGMFTTNNLPKGLYIEDFKISNKIDTLRGEGNFYLNPNGIFYITKNNDAKIIQTKKFRLVPDIKYATQSGLILLDHGTINSIFKKDSKNLNIRNRIGILKNGNIIFFMSKKEINFFDFSLKFKKFGCCNALYLDDFVSRAYFMEVNGFKKMATSG